MSKGSSAAEQRERRAKGAPEDESKGAVPELIRKMATLGLSGFFTTESALRKALGDTVPKEWVDFAAEQSDRTRQEVMDRLATEFGRVLAQVDLAELFSQLAGGHVLEVDARIRLTPDPGRQGTGIRFKLAAEEEEQEPASDDDSLD